jgi:hypothetical protein
MGHRPEWNRHRGPRRGDPPRRIPGGLGCDQRFVGQPGLGGLVVLLCISLAAVFRYGAVTDASGAITAAGTVIGTVVGTFFGVHVGTTAAAAGAQHAETGRQQAETARQQAEAARQQAESVKDTVVSGLSKIAAAAEPGSQPAVAIERLIDSINP